jgi:hypothetical protein
MRLASQRHRGFAMITAITLIAFAGVALALMTAQLGSEVDRGQRMAQEAQLRQLLIAGLHAAEQHRSDAPTLIRLPAERGEIELTPQLDGPSRHLLITARYEGIERQQLLPRP